MIDVDAVCRLLVADLDGWHESVSDGYVRETYFEHALFDVTVSVTAVYVDSLPVGYFGRRAILRALGARRTRLVARHLRGMRAALEASDPELQEGFAEVRRLVG